ncbi:MAG: DNA polymerase I [Deferribacteraceae bacterium]|jgi:DNA polymerase-1|nr:DNA polymerase I [Deferribacteraceae bacterium]
MIVILDGNSIAYRAYHKAPPLSAPDGTPTGTVHLFFNILERVRQTLKPSQIVAVFDAKGETERHRKYPAYKANREAMPEDLVAQMPIIRELLPLMGIPVYHQTGIEADDIIATLAKKSTEPVAIVTKDKDLFQLVNDNIKIYDDQSGTLLGANEAKAKYGVLPTEILSYLSLLGDKSDNIPGVLGVGEKTAAKLISEYGSLDNLYANINDLKGKVKENLERDKAQAYIAMDLISLIDIKDLAEPVINDDKNALMERFSALGMRAVAAKVNTTVEEATPQPLPAFKPCMEGVVANPTHFIAVDNELFVTDGETYDKFNSHTIPDNAHFYDLKAFIKATGSTFQGAKDYLLMSWLCDPDSGTIHKAKTEQIEEFIPKLLYMAKDIETKLEKLALTTLYTDIELPVSYTLAQMELSGIAIRPERVQAIANTLKQKIGQVASKLINRAQYDINLNSPKQLAEYLYDRLNIPQLAKSNRSTAEDTLKELAAANPEHKEMIEEILLYREYSKLLSTYTQPLLDAVAADGRIHTTFKQTGTGTGRLSSVNPNLQNIPARGDVGKVIRSAFVPKEGYSLVSLDYSQIELRILAHLSGDTNLISAFQHGKDIHTLTAMNIFNLPEADVTPDVRRLAKAVNFGIVYGLSPFGLARDTGISPKEAKSFIDAYFALYSGVKTYISNTIADTRERGYCETVLGRKRFFPEITSRNGLNRQRAERAAINAPIQGSAADIIKVAMLRCIEMIKREQFNATMSLQIHDELIFEVNESEANRFLECARVEMEGAFSLNVPLSVNASVGADWGQL